MQDHHRCGAVDQESGVGLWQFVVEGGKRDLKGDLLVVAQVAEAERGFAFFAGLGLELLDLSDCLAVE